MSFLPAFPAVLLFYLFILIKEEQILMTNLFKLPRVNLSNRVIKQTDSTYRTTR